MTTETHSTTLTTTQAWLQAACLGAAWILTIGSLVAFPVLRLVAASGFVALVVVLGISWAIAAGPARRRAASVGALVPVRAAASPRGRAAA